ncbi:MAG: DUF58 domain-containing protein [Planctomycetota bacterium]|nr:DUF58 domain-containing protein [Planctomycetota bacterium]
MSFVSRYLDPALVERLNHLSLSARRIVEGSSTGLHKSPFKGASIEFRQHRFYVAGDEPRRLDWRVLGRTDRFYVKEYDEETNLRCMLMLDASGSMAYGGSKAGGVTKFDYASRLVASLAYLMLGNTEHVGLAIFGDRIERWIPPRSGTSQLSQMIDSLEQVTARGPSNPGHAMHQAADRLGRRSLVIVVSDFFATVPSICQGLAHFGHDGHELIILRVLDLDELEFPFKTWTQLRGLEGERPRLCEPAMVRSQYLDNFARHARDLEDRCRSLKTEFAQMTTDRPLLESLTGFIQRREGRSVR